MPDRILIIGGSPWAKNSFLALKKSGFDIILSDINPECKMRKYSDHFINISAVDTDALSEAVSKFDSVVIAYCGNDFGIKSAHQINEKLFGRKLLTVDSEIFIDKYLMKLFFEENNISTANGIRTKLEDVDSLVLDYPVIVKPVVASGAYGVQHISDIQELRKYQHEFRNKIDDILVEELLSGTQHDVNGFFVEGEFYPAGISDRFFSDYPLCYPIYGYSPSCLSQAQQNMCFDSLQCIGEAAGLVTGPLKSDVFFTKEGIAKTNEVCLRFHGDLASSNVLPYTGKWFPLLEYMRYLLPNRANDIKCELENSFYSRQQVVRWEILDSGPGVFQGIDNRNELMKQPGVLEIFINKEIGDVIGEIRNNNDILGWFLTCGADYDSCKLNAEELSRHFKGIVHE